MPPFDGTVSDSKPLDHSLFNKFMSDDPAYTVHKGQLYKVTDGQGWTKTGYDSRGRAIKSSRYVSENDETYTTQTAYDPADRVIQVTYPNNKAVVAYSYDQAGHLNKVESLWGTGGRRGLLPGQRLQRDAPGDEHHLRQRLDHARRESLEIMEDNSGHKYVGKGRPREPLQ